MTTKNAISGSKGGRATVQKYGSEYMREIAKHANRPDFKTIIERAWAEYREK